MKKLTFYTLKLAYFKLATSLNGSNLTLKLSRNLNHSASINLGLTIEELVEPLLSNAKVINCILLDSEVCTEELTILF